MHVAMCMGMKLHNKFLKQHREKAARFVECINQMYEDSPSSSLLDYVQESVLTESMGGTV